MFTCEVILITLPPSYHIIIYKIKSKVYKLCKVLSDLLTLLNLPV